jgi:hypothetical protein
MNHCDLVLRWIPMSGSAPLFRSTLEESLSGSVVNLQQRFLTSQIRFIAKKSSWQVLNDSLHGATRPLLDAKGEYKLRFSMWTGGAELALVAFGQRCR